MDLEFLARRKEKWRIALRNILFTEGDIVERAEQAEDEVETEHSGKRSLRPLRRPR